jgi:hypothetical protein
VTLALEQLAARPSSRPGAGIEGDAMRIVCSLAMCAVVAAGLALPGYAAPSGTGGSVSIHVSTLSPMIALIAGILILIVPRLLNFIVAVYLIIVGLLGLMGR